MELQNSRALHDLDKDLAILGVIASIILIVYLSINVGRIIYTLTGVLTLIACIIWLLIRKNASLEFLEFSLPRSRSINLVLASLFFVFFTFSILSVYLRSNLYERPLIYFIITSLMVGIVALEIIFSQENQKYFILFQVIIIGLSIACSQVLIFPNVVGIDNWWHQMFTSKIIEAHFIPDGYSYSKLPIFHLAIASTSLITGLKYKFAGIFSVSLVQIICNSMFIFLLTKLIFNKYKISLLASLFVVIACHHIGMSCCWMPTTLAAVFIPIVLYLLWKVRRDKPLHATVLSIFFMGILILTHTVTAMCMAIILFVCWAAFNLYNILYSKTEISISLTISFLFTVAMFGWWTYASGHITILANLIKWGFSIDYVPKEVLGYALAVPVPEQIFNNVGMFLFFSLSFVGIFYMISKKGNSFSFAEALVGFTPLALGFFSLVTEHSIIEHRWWYFSQILLAIPLGVVIMLIGMWKTKNSRFIPLFSFIFVTSLAFLMIMSPTANMDNHIFSPNTGIRYTFTESEIDAASFFAQNSVGKISSDYIYATNPSSSIFVNNYNISYEQIVSLDDSLYSGNFIHDNSIKIIRREIINKPLRLGSGIYRINYDPNIVLSNSGFNKIYDNYGVTAYK